MRPVARLGDSNSGGGIITTVPQAKVVAEGLPIAVTGSRGTGHPTGTSHANGTWQTIGTSGKVFIMGMPVVLVGDVDTCGHVRLPGTSEKIFAA